MLTRLNTAKKNYDPEKVAALKEFDAFLADIQEKKSKLLREMKAIESIIEEKKELYYGLIAKSDALEERAHAVKESEDKLDLREAFVSQLEKKTYG